MNVPCIICGQMVEVTNYMKHPVCKGKYIGKLQEYDLSECQREIKRRYQDDYRKRKRDRLRAKAKKRYDKECRSLREHYDRYSNENQSIRKCLKCDCDFMSNGVYNRICDKCNGMNESVNYAPARQKDANLY